MKSTKGSQEISDRMARMREARDPSAPVMDPLAKAAADPKSRSKAIAAKCYDCEGRDSDPCWQWRVGNCTITGCPLYPVRPYQRFMGKPTPASLIGTTYEPGMMERLEEAWAR